MLCKESTELSITNTVNIINIIKWGSAQNDGFILLHAQKNGTKKMRPGPIF